VSWRLNAIQSMDSPDNVSRCSSDGDPRSDVAVGVQRRRQIRTRRERTCSKVQKHSNPHVGSTKGIEDVNRNCRRRVSKSEKLNGGKGTIVNCRHGLRSMNIR